jgi:hypothetical protein
MLQLEGPYHPKGCRQFHKSCGEIRDSMVNGQHYDHVVSGWMDEKCPIVNGILYPDDTVIRLAIDVGIDQAASVPQVKPMGKTTLGDLVGETPLQWTYLNKLCEWESKDKGVRLLGGEGGFGEDGFVALLRPNGDLVWLFFCDCSNPFTDVALTDNVVLAKSTTGLLWQFPVVQPEALAVFRSPS